MCKIIKNEDKDLYNEIYEKYLINNQNSKELTNKLKLKVSYDNKENFENLFTEPEISYLKKHINKNNIYSNFYFFYKKLTEDIENNKFSIKDFYEALKKLTVISIVLEQESNEDPQIIFETLNSSGKKLEDKDLIRNFLLLNLNEEEQENIYNTYWRKIENNVKIETKNDSYDDKMEDFLRSFLQYYTGSSSIKDTKIYNHFKTICQKENDLNKENIIQQMYKCSTYFKNIYSLKLYNKKIEDKIDTIMNIFECTSSIMPFLFYLVECKEESIIDEDKMFESLEIIESFLFRRMITGEKSGGLRNIFISLKKQIKEYLNKYSFIDILTSLLVKKYEMPSGYEFVNSFKNYSYNIDHDTGTRLIKSKKLIYKILLEIEMYKNPDLDYKNTNLELDFIYPRKNDNSKNEFDEKEFEEMEYLKTTIGNLVLTKHPIEELQHLNFEIKKNNFYKNDLFTTTQDVYNYSKWNSESIKIRSDELATIAKKIWKYYIPDVNINYNICTLNDDLMNKKIKFCFIKGKIIAFKENFVNIFIKLIQELYNKNNVIFVRKIVNNPKYARFISNNDYKKTYKYIDTNIFIDTYSNNNDKRDLLVSIIEDLNYEDITVNDITFELI